MVNTGCSIGNRVVLGPTGTYPLVHQPTVELYNGQTLQVYYGSTQPNTCYIDSPYGPIIKQCITPSGNQGNVITYVDSQITCTPPVLQTPIDFSVLSYLFMVSVLIMGALFTIKKFKYN